MSQPHVPRLKQTDRRVAMETPARLSTSATCFGVTIHFQIHGIDIEIPGPLLPSFQLSLHYPSSLPLTNLFLCSCGIGLLWLPLWQPAFLRRSTRLPFQVLCTRSRCFPTRLLVSVKQRYAACWRHSRLILCAWPLTRRDRRPR